MSGAFDVSELRAFGDDMGRATPRLAGEVRKVVMRGAVNVKKAVQNDLSQSAHFKAAARDIGFDMIERDDEVIAELGPEVGLGGKHAGGLAHIAWDGSPTGGGGSVRPPEAALLDEEPGLLSALDAAIGRAFQ